MSFYKISSSIFLCHFSIYQFTLRSITHICDSLRLGHSDEWWETCSTCILIHTLQSLTVVQYSRLFYPIWYRHIYDFWFKKYLKETFLSMCNRIKNDLFFLKIIYSFFIQNFQNLYKYYNNYKFLILYNRLKKLMLMN